MKKYLLFLFFYPLLGKAQKDLTFFITNNGMAPVSSFSLKEPAFFVIGDFRLAKNFRFHPVSTFSLKDGNPWFGDFWFYYDLPFGKDKKWTATLGADWDLFFKKSQINGKKTVESILYMLFESSLKFAPNKNDKFLLKYWRTHVLNTEQGVRGNYLSLKYSREQELGKFSLYGDADVFGLDYSDGTKGLASSLQVGARHEKSGLFIFSHMMQPLTVKGLKTDFSFGLGIKVKIK